LFRNPMMALAPSWQGAQMAFLGSLYTDAMGLQMQQSMLPLLLPPPPRLALLLPPPSASGALQWC